MQSTPAAADVPIQTPRRYGRLMLVVGGFVLLIAALWWWLFASFQSVPAGGNPFFGWRAAIPAVTIAGLLLFGVVTALLDMRQRTRWMVVFAVLLTESLLLTTVELVAVADYRWENLVRIVFSWQSPIVMHLIAGLGTVLAVHTLVWPIRALLGWQVQWAGEQPSARERLLTTWHLAAWVALMAILLLGPVSSSGSGLMMAIVLLLEFVSLLVGLPVLILATRCRHLAFWIPAVLAGLMGLSWAVSEATYFFTKVTGGGSGVPVGLLGIWNGAVAGTVLLAIFLLRWAGLVFDLPISRREAALRRASTSGMPASSLARREFQFSLRSLLILTTLLCLGPGAYIAWEREQCRRGTAILVQIDKLGGLMEPISQPRPAWLRAVLGDNAFRQVYIISLEKSNVVDGDLAQLSGLPGLQSLWLGNAQVTDAGLASLSHLKNLRDLSLDSTKVTDAGLVHLSGLTNLRMLSLQRTNITGNGLAHLSPLVTLDWFFLDNTDVGDASLTHLPTDLKWLGLTGTRVTDAGLAPISRLTKLENLHLSNNPITDAGLVHLGALPNLQTLVIKNAGVTDAGAANLNEKLPALKIHR